MKTPEDIAQRFERDVMPYERRVYSLCFHMMGNAQDAADCAQDALLRAFRAYGRFRGDADIGTWLYRVATNACIDALRKRRDALSLDALRDDGFDPASDAPSPLSRLEKKEQQALVRQALSEALPPNMRACVVLCDIQGASYEQAAEALQIPQGTLKSRLNRAREKMRRYITLKTELSQTTPV